MPQSCQCCSKQGTRPITIRIITVDTRHHLMAFSGVSESINPHIKRASCAPDRCHDVIEFLPPASRNISPSVHVSQDHKTWPINYFWNPLRKEIRVQRSLPSVHSFCFQEDPSSVSQLNVTTTAHNHLTREHLSRLRHCWRRRGFTAYQLHNVRVQIPPQTPTSLERLRAKTRHNKTTCNEPVGELRLCSL